MKGQGWWGQETTHRQGGVGDKLPGSCGGIMRESTDLQSHGNKLLGFFKLPETDTTVANRSKTRIY